MIIIQMIGWEAVAFLHQREEADHGGDVFRAGVDPEGDDRYEAGEFVCVEVRVVMVSFVHHLAHLDPYLTLFSFRISSRDVVLRWSL